MRLRCEQSLGTVQMHKETLQAELKLVKEDIHRVTLELTERQQRVEKLHAKHDVLVSRNATPDGEIHTQVWTCRFCDAAGQYAYYCNTSRHPVPYAMMTDHGCF